MIPRSNSKVEIERTFNISAEKLFVVLSDPTYVHQWFFPGRDFQLTIEQFDFAIGGSYRFVYTLPDKTISRIEGRFLDIVRPIRLTFTWTWLPPDPHAGGETVVAMRLSEIAGNTTLIVTHERLPGDYLSVFEPGWTQTIEHLNAVVIKHFQTQETS